MVDIADLVFSNGVIKEPIRCIIYGVEGIGKSTLASQFPSPVFLDVEHGTTKLNVKRALPQNFEELTDGINKLTQGKQTETIVIDSLDMAEVLIEEYVAQKLRVTAIEDIPHGRGYVALDKATIEFIKLLNTAWRAGKNIVLVAHAKVDKFIPVGEPEGYDRYSLKLRKRTQAFYKEWADLILFANYKTFIKSTDKRGNKTKAIAYGNERKMYAERTENYDAKNRFGLPAEMELSYEEIKRVIESE